MSRPIRSYVLRQGRTTPAQRRALDGLFPKYGLPFSARPIDSAAVFGRRAPLVLEIGSGMGETTAEIAATQPQRDFIAVEVHGPGVGSLLNRIAAAGLTNLRVVRHDAAEVLEHMIADGGLAAIHLFFPDPWPKKRHHKRRLVQPAFAALAARKLAPGGLLHAATDWPDYAERMLAVLRAEPLLEEAPAGSAARPVTKFESRGLRLGNPVRDLAFRRRGILPAAR
ncbi:MAG: tRNA (guanosine(46)-N7)-methyltransferase TrmB [Betaproteobacteria bacterium RIFCSPHIGHO2_12_FULL_69_13]|nr:MAG: tRNA (guanosine(46)-N7)-methyltransferase TrmB [Betaproteobacteria bacterium RIFCSPHIGHO2_12_FULL_69_13]OGA66302.1 MAG: tRNA (guanosine(46)-N7)-methyltransferase TrmB [Betaproteobacteria bacterium RIFCSPLOWO2_12_FULL_68_20]